jgi:hypothetical protein
VEKILYNKPTPTLEGSNSTQRHPYMAKENLDMHPFVLLCRRGRRQSMPLLDSIRSSESLGLPEDLLTTWLLNLLSRPCPVSVRRGTAALICPPACVSRSLLTHAPSPLFTAPLLVVLKYPKDAKQDNLPCSTTSKPCHLVARPHQPNT